MEGFLIEYATWLRFKGIELRKVMNNALDNEKQIISNAFIREVRNNQTLTKKQIETLNKFKE
ncbi:MAG: hypothetical protein ACTSSB_11305 [Candidatus Heimdallarchaeota archaeon]